MQWPTYIASRQEHDQEREAFIQSLFHDAPDQAQRAREQFYPVDIRGAIAELRRRGLDACETSFPAFCDLASLRRIGRSYVLYPADIDAVALRMAEVNLLLPSAKRRKEMGVSYGQEAEVQRELLHRRYGKFAAAVGVGLAEFYAAIRCGLADPVLSIGFDVAQAKAWFTEHRQDAEFLKHCQRGVLP